MGTPVYDSGEPLREGAHVYAHSRRDGKEGVAYLIINSSLTESTTLELPCSAERYTLSAPQLRSNVMQLNGKDLVLDENGALPVLTPEIQPAGSYELAPASIAFLVL